MNVLALDTSTSLASIAIVSNEVIRAESAFSCDRSLSARLVPEIEHLLTLSGLTVGDIDLYAASTGPGSFTGVRCGVATIQGMALATHKPCTGFSSLAALAMNCLMTPHPVCALLDARKNEVYAALYNCNDTRPTAMIADCVMPLDQFLLQIRDCYNERVIFVGDGARRFHSVIESEMENKALFAPLSLAIGRAAQGALLARDAFHHGPPSSPELLLPDYIRPSEAELARRSKR